MKYIDITTGGWELRKVEDCPTAIGSHKMKRIYFYNPQTQERAYGHIPANENKVEYIKDVMIGAECAYLRDNASDSFNAWARFYARYDFCRMGQWSIENAQYSATSPNGCNLYEVILRNDGFYHIYKDCEDAVISFKNEYEALQFAENARYANDKNNPLWKRD